MLRQDIGTCFLILLGEPLVWRNLDIYFYYQCVFYVNMFLFKCDIV